VAPGVSAPARPQRRPARKRTVSLDMRVASAFGVSPVATGFLIAGLLVAFFFALRWMLGELGPPRASPGWGGLDPAARGAVVLALLVGYTIGAGRAIGLAIYRDLQKLGLEDPEHDLSIDETPALARSPETHEGARTAGWIGAALGLSIYLLVGFVFVRSYESGQIADGIYFAIVVPLLLALMARAAWWTLRQAREMAATIDAHLAVDLVERVPAKLAGRVALRGALVWIVGISISTLMFFSPDFAGAVLPVVLGTLVVAGAALLIPVRDVRKRIRAAKQAELAAIDVQLREARAAALAGPGAEGRLADLLAWRAHVESVREWPFDSSIYARFALYLLIPLGSWLAGALVDWLVNRVLD
jgi:hypothetical protein